MYVSCLTHLDVKPIKLKIAQDVRDLCNFKFSTMFEHLPTRQLCTLIHTLTPTAHNEAHAILKFTVLTEN